MSKRVHILGSACNMIGGLIGVLGWLLRFARLMLAPKPRFTLSFCEDSVRKYMVKPEKPRKPSGTWLPFLRNHLDVAWAMDFFTVNTKGFRSRLDGIIDNWDHLSAQ